MAAVAGGCEELGRYSSDADTNLLSCCRRNTPDTALVCDLEDTATLDAYFSGILVEPKTPLGAAPSSVKDWAKVRRGPSEGLAAEPANASSKSNGAL